MQVGDLVKHVWKGASWIGIVVGFDEDEAIVFRPELSHKFFRWPIGFHLEVISESR